MADEFEISIFNESGASRTYFLFTELPKVKDGNTSDIFQNIYMRSETIPSGSNGSSSITFALRSKFFAICGSSFGPLHAGVRMSPSHYEEIPLAGDDGDAMLWNFNFGCQDEARCRI
jgi:hypothetical protein